MYDYTLSSLTEKIDTNFVISSWLPAFVAVLANLGFLTLLVGPDALAAWAYNLTEIEEFMVLLIVLLIITMVALLLRALSFLIFAFFTGESLPRRVAEWATRGQRRNRARALAQLGHAANGPTDHPVRDQVRRLIEQRYPQEETALRPTRLGNVLATAAEYPWVTYGMDGLLWLPHLWSTAPSYVSDALDGARARLQGLLNLSLICALLAVEGVLVLGVVTGHWTSAIGWAIVGAALAWFCYQAAVNQSLEVASQIRVAFNLYRQEILKQMGLAIPDTVAAERALWQSLTRELLGQPPAAAPTGDGTEPAVRPNG
jgi:Na+/melibiose symporter-like transporter